MNKQALSVLLAIALLFPVTLFGQETQPEPYVNKRIVILLSTRDYKQALSFARRLSNKSGVALKLRDLSPDKKIGLSFPRQECEDNGFGFPCYIARGRSDDGLYLSIEHSSAYQGFRPGYYIVVGGSFEDRSPKVKMALAKFRPHAKDAYAKRSRIYVGCIH